MTTASAALRVHGGLAGPVGLRLEGDAQVGLERLRGCERGEVQALSFSDSRDSSGDVVFAGYGLRAGGPGFGYDSYAGLDVQDKIVLVLRYLPEDAEGDCAPSLARYSGLRYKAMLARAARRGRSSSSPARDRRTPASWCR